jgi:hypothetical protein
VKPDVWNGCAGRAQVPQHGGAIEFLRVGHQYAEFVVGRRDGVEREDCRRRRGRGAGDENEDLGSVVDGGIEAE